jgi:GAF domain-containing protein
MRKAKHAKPASKKLKPERAAAGRSLRNQASARRDLENRLAESLEQQTATSQILGVISSSPTDVEPVFKTILASTNRLCEASFSILFLWDGEALTAAATENVSPRFADFLRTARARPQARQSPVALAALERRVVHVADVLADSRFTPANVPSHSIEGARSILSVPMLRDGQLVGVLNTWRLQPTAFTDKQIELLKTFADQAVIAIENVRLFKELEARNRDLGESLDQRSATADILRAIATSPNDVRPVFDAIVESAVRLCGAHHGAVFRFDGDLLHFVAHHNFSEAQLEDVRKQYPMGPIHAHVSGRAILSGSVVQIPDVDLDPEYGSPLARRGGFRSLLGVPILRGGAPIGAIVIYRPESGSFPDQQISLLKTFADQAVIAIENVRLFKELETRNRDLTESLEQQTATAEILRVISSSPTDVQPVFDTIVRSALRLCNGATSAVFRVEGGMLHHPANYGGSPEALAAARARYPRPVGRDSVPGLAVLTRSEYEVPDTEGSSAIKMSRDTGRILGIRSLLAVPMLHDGQAVGAIVVTRREPGGFAAPERSLLKTFADQAVIAIENVRLFTELQQKNDALTHAHAQITEALEQQTATSEILRVISRSQTDVQPVFDTIVRSAVKLCNGLFGALFQFDGEQIHHVAQHNNTPEALEAAHRVYPAPLSRALLPTRAILERAVVHIPDVALDREFQHHALSRAVGFRSGLYVPMLREGAPIGVIVVNRAEAGPFSDSEIELLKTFADQAVIAVENVRLFKELEARTGELTQSVEKLTALGEVSRALSSTLDVETVLDTIVSRASQLAGGAGCSIYEYDEGAERFELRATHNYAPEFVEALRAVPLRKGEGLMGRAAEMREPVQVPDITQPGAYQSSVRDTLIRFGYRALLAVPLLREDQIIGSLSFNRKAPGDFLPEVVDVLRTFATQSALAIQNARLFREIADKSTQLEAASRHKSEFLANMSHELRTPLNAIIGFSEVLTERMFGELNEKQDEYLKDIHASGQHLLSLINDILDLSKIEAGRMELERSAFDLPNAIENALILVRERASRRGISLGNTIDERLGVLDGDERKVKQVLLNLLSNALKFTPEGGRIDVSARLDDHVAEVSVADTGIGIAPADQDAVFEEFRQVGTAEKKAEGTGLGLALSRKFIELHGGKIWVESQLGTGSTFRFTLPLRQ